MLWYNVFGSNDAAAKLGGKSVRQSLRVYRGSANDPVLNRSVRRVAPALGTAAQVAKYQTTGGVRVPLVTMHTTAMT